MLYGNINLFSVSGLLILITFPILTILSLANYRSRLHAIWAVFNIAVGIWGLGAFLISISRDANHALIFWKLAHGGIIFIPVLYYHVSHVFCELTNRKTLFFLYLQAVFFLILNLSGNLFPSNLRYSFSSFYYIEPTSWYYLFFSIWLFTAVAGTLNYVLAHRGFTGIKKIQIRYFILATIFGFTGGLANFFPVFHIDIFPYGNLLLPIYPIVVTYAILRYRLMDINLVFRKSMVYSLAAGILTSLFVVLVITMTKLLSDVASINSFSITIVAALIIAILFNPLKNKIQLLIDRRFYKNTYDYYPTIRKISRRLTAIFDLDELFNYIGNKIYLTLNLETIYLLYTASGSGYNIVYHQSHKKDKKEKEYRDPEKDRDGLRLKKSSELVRFFKKSDDVLIRDELPGYERELGQEIIERIKSDLEPFHGAAAVPVFIDKKVILLLVLGEKLSGDMYTNEDISLLNIISNQISVAIKNVELYKDKVHSERLASMGMMSATFAHEIRNPLTSLKTFAQLMPEKYNDEEFRETFSKIVVGEIDRIDGLIKDLLDYSANKKSTRLNNFNLVSLVDETVNYVKGKLQLEKRDIEISKKYLNDEIFMSGDAEKLKQTFINILMNGCQAMNGEGELTVKIQMNSRNADVSITDTGKGIHPDDISKIFDPFVTSRELGVGLGLAISKRIIEDHNGKIHVKSQLSKGTTFTINLPVQIDEISI